MWISVLISVKIHPTIIPFDTYCKLFLNVCLLFPFGLKISSNINYMVGALISIYIAASQNIETASV
jgi:hypothetical protein